MKAFIWILVAVCGVVIASAIVNTDRQKGSPPQKPPAEAPAAGPSEPAAPVNVPVPASELKPAVAQTDTAPQAADSSPSTAQTTSTNSISPIHKKVEALLSAKSGAEKRALFDELRKDGQLEAVVADLKQMAAANPNDAEIPTTLGEAELNECRALSENGAANVDQMGILAMEADQAFNSALQIDPKNWEAQYVKASAMFYWPANPQLNNQLVQNLTSLIDQQETISPDPDYAQTYLLLGNEYQKIGQPDKAMATWQLGAQEYPADSALQKKLAGQ